MDERGCVRRPPGGHQTCARARSVRLWTYHPLTESGCFRLGVALCAMLLVAVIWAATASAETQGEAIVAAARAMEGAGYPYCFDGGTINGPTVGTTDSESDGAYSNCAQIGKVGFDCTGLTLYAVYQGTGNAGLSHDGYQAKSGGGQVIGGQSELQPGDIVYFDYNSGNGLNYINHAGIYVGGGNVLSAVSEKWGIRTESIAWYEAGGLHFVGAVRHWSGNVGPPGEGSFVQESGSPAIYRIVGGAPLYVSSWNAFGGSQPYTVISQEQFNALRAFPADGTLISSTATGRAYEIAGGAPEYISAADASSVPGWGSRPVLGVDQWDLDNTANPAAHLRLYPADGTLISNVDNGRAYVVAGGAPLYISAADASQVPGWGTQPVTGLSGYEFGAYEHLRPYPADGTLIANVDNGRAYIVAGGAPLYISAADASQVPGWGTQPVTGVSGYEFGAYEHLRPYPADGTLISNVDNGRAYVVAGGAPLYISAADASQIPGWGVQPVVGVSGYEFSAYEHLRPHPADGTFLSTTAGKVFRIAGGAPFAVSSWSVFGGTQPSVTVDQWDLENPAEPYAHIRTTPNNGTVVEGLPSATYWTFQNGERAPTDPSAGAITVDDTGLAVYPIKPTPNDEHQKADTQATTPTAGQGVLGTQTHGRSNGPSTHSGALAKCRRIKNRRKRTKCVAAARHRHHSARSRSRGKRHSR
jgi:cell wall-associated NlpC family hydrolase